MVVIVMGLRVVVVIFTEGVVVLDVVDLIVIGFSVDCLFAGLGLLLARKLVQY